MECKICKRKPNQIAEYMAGGKEYGVSPEAYVKQEEGTYNRKTGEFYCTTCYLNEDMPEGTA